MRKTVSLCIVLTGCLSDQSGERPRPLLQQPWEGFTSAPGSLVVPDDVTTSTTTTTTTTTTATGTQLTTLAAPDPAACPGAVGGTWFQDVRECAGLSSAINLQPGQIDWLLEAATGQAFADFDGDTWLDILVTGPAGMSQLFLGSSTGEFTVRADPALATAEALGVATTDYDNDGDIDVFLAGPGADTYLENTGTELIVGNGPSDLNVTLGVTVADIDGDGDHEVYTANYTCPDCVWNTVCDYTSDGLWVDGASGWEEITQTSFTPTNAHCGFGFIGLFSDFDGDLDPDIYVVNDRGVEGPDAADGPTLRNSYFRNDGPGCGAACFTEIAYDNGSVAFIDGMGADSGDYDNDGDFDLLVSYAGPPLVLENDGTGNFTNVSESIGLLTPVGISGWGIVWLDYDNDGDVDIFMATTYQDRFYVNQGGTYSERTDSALPVELIESRGVAVGDYDRDGYLDLLVGDPGGLYHLYRNTTANSNNWVGVRLVGSTGPGGRDALGAVVTVTDTSGRVQNREILSGRGNGGGSDLGVHFGLGSDDVSEVKVQWPDGVVEILPVPQNAWTVVTR